MAGYEWVSFTTDYGQADGFTAACHGVIARIAPAARVIDVTHQVPPQDVRRGAGVLAQTVPWLPPAVHLAVVDPGVGTGRRGVCLVAGRSVLIGPDNGLLVPAAEALGGITTAYQLAEPAYWLPPISATFHGRDVFAPVAAHLCAGVEPAAVGPEVPRETLVRLPAPTVTVAVGKVTAQVRSVDGFGNVQLAATVADLTAAGIAAGDRAFVQIGPAARPALVASTFGDVGPGELVVYLDSAGYVAVAVNGGSAAAALDVRDDDSVLLLSRPAPPTAPQSTFD
ncbi:MAG TPA: SAM-dependent chlorinase/fluorinase [Mycobacteriales bacterium]|nr:SAM-dependent chlorinase/fluorinase [Mycobacteriales bacterium]